MMKIFMERNGMNFIATGVCLAGVFVELILDKPLLAAPFVFVGVVNFFMAVSE